MPCLAVAQAQDYLWPTDASQHLTSTFGETRSAHYHSGLDIKTWGREGYKVFASKDGVVYRLAVSVEGYGKVIYLKHDDGSFTVYAHLQRFNDALQAYIDSVRMMDYSFETNLIVEHLGIEVSQGEVIGYTGSTGVGPPHLHFEVRDSEDNPINALRTNLRVQDTIAPTISAMLVFPLSPETTIRGSKFPQLYYPFKDDSGDVSFGTIEANGSIGIAVSNFDEADGVTNKYATFELGLLYGEDTLFYERLDQFKFAEDDVMFMDRIPDMGAYRRSYQTLYKKDGPPNPFYKIVDRRTSINPGDSVASFIVFATDYYGNKTEASFGVDGASTITPQHNKASLNPMHRWFWTENWVYDGAEVINLRNFERGISWNAEKNQYLFGKPEANILVTRFLPEKSYSLITPDQKLSVKFSPNTFFDTLSVLSYTSFLDGFPYVNLQPAVIPSRKEFKIEFYLGEDFEDRNRYQLFRIDRTRDRITHINSELKGRTVHGYPSNLGEFIVMPDNEPPVLQTPEIIKTDYGKWLVHISAEDSLSGINFRESNAYVNGERGILEYDNEEDLLIYYHPRFIPKKENVITLTVLDKARNKITQSFKINQM
ncbi:MAG: M23 family metallopeptidase [Balneolaceae bacterium]|nr:M23 family metallopeptidase [Balneolaceae bacterium]MBO6546978.1 M23 family metallopeptidase [Balneolaceae bacterium]MBO6649338.1 M23 family metallopeptidase [Balneolaceae bacterium]